MIFTLLLHSALPFLASIGDHGHLARLLESLEKWRKPRRGAFGGSVVVICLYYSKLGNALFQSSVTIMTLLTLWVGDLCPSDHSPGYR